MTAAELTKERQFYEMLNRKWREGAPGTQYAPIFLQRSLQKIQALEQRLAQEQRVRQQALEAQRRREEEAQRQRIAAERAAAERRRAAAAAEAHRQAAIRAEQAKQQLRIQVQNRLTAAQSSLVTAQQAVASAQQSLTALQRDLQVEEKEIAEFDSVPDDSRIVVVLGLQGSGVSTICNRLAGATSKFADDGVFVTSPGAQQCTTQVTKHTTALGGVRICIVDTPCVTNRNHANDLAAFLKGCGGINAFLLIRNATNVRFDAQIRRMLTEYHTMFGVDFFKRLVVVASHVNYDNLQFEANQQERQLRRDILSEFRLDEQTAPLPVIPMGVENFETGLSRLSSDCIPETRFECPEIRSPVDELRRRVQAKTREVQTVCNARNVQQAIVQRIQQELRVI